MRVATWNLERGGRTRAARAAQQLALSEMDADVIVLTEPGSAYSAGPGVVTSPATRPRARSSEPWIAIVGLGVESVRELPYQRLAAAARVTVGGCSVIVYGTVLPWLSVALHAPELIEDGESSFESFVRVLRAQVVEILELQRRYALPVLWAGDFNQSLDGKLSGGSAERRAALLRALSDVELVAWNQDSDHAVPGIRAVDLVCGPRAVQPVAQGRIDPVRSGVTMSDHAGY